MQFFNMLKSDKNEYPVDCFLIVFTYVYYIIYV